MVAESLQKEKNKGRRKKMHIVCLAPLASKSDLYIDISEMHHVVAPF
jgi:hypothetical protein